MLITIHRKILAVFSAQSPAAIFLVNIAILLLLGWVDFVTGDYSLIVFYLIPVSLATWFLGRRYGILFCLLSVVVRIVADECSVPASFSRSTLHYWNELMEFLFLLIVSLLFYALKKYLENENTMAS